MVQSIGQNIGELKTACGTTTTPIENKIGKDDDTHKIGFITILDDDDDDNNVDHNRQNNEPTTLSVPVWLCSRIRVIYLGMRVDFASLLSIENDIKYNGLLRFGYRLFLNSYIRKQRIIILLFSIVCTWFHLLY